MIKKETRGSIKTGVWDPAITKHNGVVEKY